MSWNRKLDDARKHYRRAHNKVEHCRRRADKTGAACDRMVLAEAVREEFESACELEGIAIQEARHD